MAAHLIIYNSISRPVPCVSTLHVASRTDHKMAAHMFSLQNLLDSLELCIAYSTVYSELVYVHYQNRKNQILYGKKSYWLFMGDLDFDKKSAMFNQKSRKI